MAALTASIPAWGGRSDGIHHPGGLSDRKFCSDACMDVFRINNPEGIYSLQGPYFLPGFIGFKRFVFLTPFPRRVK
jgi:hypothetical protein